MCRRSLQHLWWGLGRALLDSFGVLWRTLFGSEGAFLKICAGPGKHSFELSWEAEGTLSNSWGALQTAFGVAGRIFWVLFGVPSWCQWPNYHSCKLGLHLV